MKNERGMNCPVELTLGLIGGKWLRTGVESSNTQDVLDDNLDKFIEASLKAGL
jgi:hypothetical protein